MSRIERALRVMTLFNAAAMAALLAWWLSIPGGQP
jgi:hypothetical protein